MTTEIEEYFVNGCGRCERFATAECSTRKWNPGLKELRKICVESGLVETVKWGHPCYVHGDRNIAILGALRSDFRISFFNAALLKDPQHVLEKPGPNTRHPDMIRFVTNAQVAQMSPTIRAYLAEAIDYASAGIKPPRELDAIELPAELVETLAADAELAEAFDRLTAGRQRSYVIALRSAKQPKTRIARIAKFRDRILTGKGAMER